MRSTIAWAGVSRPAPDQSRSWGWLTTMRGNVAKATCVVALGLVLLFIASAVERSGWAAESMGPGGALRSGLFRSGARAQEAAWPNSPFDRWSNSTARMERVGALRREQLQRYYDARSRCTNWQTWKAADFPALDEAVLAKAEKDQGGTPLIDKRKNSNSMIENYGYMFANGAEYYAKEGKPLPKKLYDKGDLRDDMPMEVCIDPNPNAKEGVMFYRFGPMVGKGGYDWHHFGAYPLPLHPNANFVTGKMMAPVTEDGVVLGYPPIHVHHAHICHRGVLHWLDSHGDTACTAGWGGEACYLRHFPRNYGLHVNKTDGLALEVLLNDVREYPAPEASFYFEVGLYWKAKVKKRAAAVNLTLAKSFGPGDRTNHYFQTQAMSPKRSVAWSYGRWPTRGRVLRDPDQNNPWLHAHRTLFDQIWVFAATPEELGLTPSSLEILEKGPSAPYVIPNQDRAWYPSDDEFAALIDRMQTHPKLRCWLRSKADGVSLDYVDGSPPAGGGKEGEEEGIGSLEPWRANWKKTWYDRLGQIECKEWMFDRSEPWLFVAVNGEQVKGMYDNLVALQHNEFRLWYESFDDLQPPTHELWGAHTSDGKGPTSPMIVPDTFWAPPKSLFRNGAARLYMGPLVDFVSRIAGRGVVTEQAQPEASCGTMIGSCWLHRVERLLNAAFQALYPQGERVREYMPMVVIRMTQWEYKSARTDLLAIVFERIAKEPAKT